MCKRVAAKALSRVLLKEIYNWKNIYCEAHIGEILRLFVYFQYEDYEVFL